MNVLKLAMVVCLLFVVSILQAQDYAFRVLVNKGKNEVKSGDGWQQIKVGSSLKQADELKVSDNAYIGLAHVSGKTIELKQAGKYKVKDLETRISGGASVLNKYTDFVLSVNTVKKNNLSATGAVSRGSEIKLFLPLSTQNPLIYNDDIIINWDAEKIPGPYVVTFNSLFDDELMKIEVKESSVKINLSDASFANEDNILVIVKSKSDPNKQSNKYTLKRLSKGDKARIKGLLSEISTQVQDQTAMNKLVLAGFYEQNGLLIDATTAFMEAIQLAPDVPNLKEQYNDYLLRNGLKDQPTEKK